MNLAYLAGIIDGEGCIGFAKCRKNVYIRLLITNTNIRLLKLIQKEFGGDIQPLALRKVNWKQGYSLRIAHTRAVNLLDKVVKYLEIKHEQAFIAFAWHAIRPGNGGRIDKEALEYLCKEMTCLNKKGIYTNVATTNRVSE